MPLLLRGTLCAVALAAAGCPAAAQSQPLPDAAAPVPPAAVTPAAAASAPPAPAPVPRVEVTGAPVSPTEQRRQSTAAMTVIGRDDIERFGDSTVGDLLKRLPGVTTTGPAGRGGAPRMRGLGSGYTQILVDGQRLPGGFSLDSLSPDQIERIEVMRAPTAETGARAIAGTINIVTRDGFRQRLNEVKLVAGVEGGRLQPNISWLRNGGDGDLAYNVNASVFRQHQPSSGRTVTDTDDLANGPGTDRRQVEAVDGLERRQGLRAGGRFQWRLGEADSLTLSPFLIHVDNATARRAELVQPFGAPPPSYAQARTDGDGGFDLLRLQAQWRGISSDGTRLEATASGSSARSDAVTVRQEFDAAGAPGRLVVDDVRSRERSVQIGGKLSRLVTDEHSLVTGAELEHSARREDAVQGGATGGSDLADTLDATVRRVALYAQDEWTVSPTWSAQAGLRWESIRVAAEGRTAPPGADNQSSIWTPLLHAVWKPEAKSRDQLRFSLTRSYRTPSLQNLVARPVVNPCCAADQPNDPTRPDRIGNPDLRPELATGLDVAAERYLADGGLISVSVFHRRIRDLIRTVTREQADVDWADGPRWVARPENIGAAVTQGIELEAKFKLSSVWSGAPPTDLRLNSSWFRSRVDSVPGPDNRLDQQPGATANLGADHRIAGTGLGFGANLNWTSGDTTQLSAQQRVVTGIKRVFDAYASWAQAPDVRWRLSVGNATHDDARSSSLFRTGEFDQGASTTNRTYTNARIELQIKL